MAKTFLFSSLPRAKITTLIFFLVMVHSQVALAWGDTGHRVVCEIALQLVKPETKEIISVLLADDPEFHNFADSCIFPDHGRGSRGRIRGDEHYVNLSRDAQGLETNECPEAPQCVLTAIESDRKLLSSRDSSKQIRKVALMALGHWVGDIHQPLHVSFLDDRGGNRIASNGCARNLHSAWDTCLVQVAVGADPQAAALGLISQLDEKRRRHWANLTPRDWANEAFAVTKARSTEYCIVRGSRCEPIGATVMLTAEYERYAVLVIREQLSKAGVRLAHLLDNALSGR